MSSLLAMAKKGKIKLVCQDTHGANAIDRRLASHYIEKILHRDTIHIRAQNILSALMEHEEAPGGIGVALS